MGREARSGRVSSWLWPVVLILSTVAVAVVTEVTPDVPLRPYIVMWFLFVCPGMSLIRFIRLRDAVAEWTLALALSFTLDASVATVLMYAGLWSPSMILGILMGLCLVCVIIQSVFLWVAAYRGGMESAVVR